MKRDWEYAGGTAWLRPKVRVYVVNEDRGARWFVDDFGGWDGIRIRQIHGIRGARLGRCLGYEGRGSIRPQAGWMPPERSWTQDTASEWLEIDVRNDAFPGDRVRFLVHPELLEHAERELGISVLESSEPTE